MSPAGEFALMMAGIIVVFGLVCWALASSLKLKERRKSHQTSRLYTGDNPLLPNGEDEASRR